MEDAGRNELQNEETTNPDPAQAWFWTERWQQMERKADEEIAAGHFMQFDDVEAFLAYLDRAQTPE